MRKAISTPAATSPKFIGRAAFAFLAHAVLAPIVLGLLVSSTALFVPTGGWKVALGLLISIAGLTAFTSGWVAGLAAAAMIVHSGRYSAVFVIVLAVIASAVLCIWLNSAAGRHWEVAMWVVLAIANVLLARLLLSRASAGDVSIQ